MRAMLIALMTLATSIAAADAPRPKVLVLPLAESQAIDAGVARTFDARLLVALEDSKRIQVITHDEELECTTMKCLAATGVELGVAYVLSLAVVREDAGLTVFGALIDVKTATAWRRIELPRVNPATLSKSAPGELVPQILGITAKTAVLGFSLATGEALTATQEIQDQITAMRAFKVIPLGGNDRSALTHRADITLTELSIEEPRRHLCRWLDGKLVGTFAVTELATGQVVFTKTVTIEASRRAHFSSRTEISQLLIDRAVADWMTAFRASGGIKPRR
ncbi:MAG: hypothetical protein ABI867_11925 [Kofleriaceae bacterium]